MEPRRPTRKLEYSGSDKDKNGEAINVKNLPLFDVKIPKTHKGSCGIHCLNEIDDARRYASKECALCDKKIHVKCGVGHILESHPDDDDNKSKEVKKKMREKWIKLGKKREEFDDWYGEIEWPVVDEYDLPDAAEIMTFIEFSKTIRGQQEDDVDLGEVAATAGGKRGVDGKSEIFFLIT